MLALLAATVSGAYSPAWADDVAAAYNSLLAPLPGNVPSQCFECAQVNEFGDKVTLAPGTSRRLDSVVVTLSSWACETGSGVACSTRRGRSFTHPITLKIYASNPGFPNLPGPELATITRNFAIPFRPSADPTCPDSGAGAGTAWRASPTQCYNGKAVNITFDMRHPRLMLPNTVIWSVTFDTQTAGYHPLGVAGPYNSLNVGVSPAATVGTDVDPNGAFVNSSDAGFYCDDGAGGVDVFRNDTNNTNNCWAGLVPAARINVKSGQDEKDRCEDGGWRNMVRPDGSHFKNEDECD